MRLGVRLGLAARALARKLGFVLNRRARTVATTTLGRVIKPLRATPAATVTNAPRGTVPVILVRQFATAAGTTVGEVIAPASGLNFGGVPALPSSAYSDFTTAAETAATAANTELSASLTAQDVIDTLAVGRGVCFPAYDGCLDASGGSVVSAGSAVGALQTVTGTEIATESNASLRPALTASGAYSDGTKSMSLGDLSAWTQGESFAVVDPDSGPSFNQLWILGTAAVGFQQHFGGANAGDFLRDSFGGNVRGAVGLTGAQANPCVYNARRSTTNTTIFYNGTQLIDVASTTGFPAGATLFTGFFLGTCRAISLNDAPYNTNQRAMLKHFLASLFSITVA
jgi:hypothetical protein